MVRLIPVLWSKVKYIPGLANRSFLKSSLTSSSSLAVPTQRAPPPRSFLKICNICRCLLTEGFNHADVGWLTAYTSLHGSLNYAATAGRGASVGGQALVPRLCLTCKAETRCAVPSRARATDWLAGFGTQLELVGGVARCTRQVRTPRVAQTIPRTLQPQFQIASRVIF